MKGGGTYTNPNHARMAVPVFTAATPNWLMSGRIHAVAKAMMKPRNALFDAPSSVKDKKHADTQRKKAWREGRSTDMVDAITSALRECMMSTK